MKEERNLFVMFKAEKKIMWTLERRSIPATYTSHYFLINAEKTMKKKT